MLGLLARRSRRGDPPRQGRRPTTGEYGESGPPWAPPSPDSGGQETDGGLPDTPETRTRKGSDGAPGHSDERTGHSDGTRGGPNPSASLLQSTVRTARSDSSGKILTVGFLVLVGPPPRMLRPRDVAVGFQGGRGAVSRPTLPMHRATCGCRSTGRTRTPLNTTPRSAASKLFSSFGVWTQTPPWAKPPLLFTADIRLYYVFQTVRENPPLSDSD